LIYGIGRHYNGSFRPSSEEAPGGYKKEIGRIHKKQDLEELAYTSGRVEDRGTGGT
jgi:hypothetical protein